MPSSTKPAEPRRCGRIPPVSVRSAIMLRFHDALLDERQAVLDLVQ